MNNSQGQPKTPSWQKFVEFLFYFHEVSGGHCPIVTKKKDGDFRVEPDLAQRTIKGMHKWLDIIPNELMSGAKNKNLIKIQNCSIPFQSNNYHIISLTQKGMNKFLSNPENYNAFGGNSFVSEEAKSDSAGEDKSDIAIETEINLLNAVKNFNECFINHDKRGCSQNAGNASLTLWKFLIEKANGPGKQVSMLEIWMRELCPMPTISKRLPLWHNQHIIRLDFKDIETDDLITDLNKWLNQKTYFNETIGDIIQTRRHIHVHNEQYLRTAKIEIKNQINAVRLLGSPLDGTFIPPTIDCVSIAIARYILWWLWRIRVAKSQEPHFSSLVQTYQP